MALRLPSQIVPGPTPYFLLYTPYFLQTHHVNLNP